MQLVNEKSNIILIYFCTRQMATSIQKENIRQDYDKL